MKVRKIFFTILILLIAMSVIAVSATSVRYARVKKGQTVDFVLGRSGIQFEKSQFTGTVKLSRYPTSNIHGIEFTQRPLDVRFTDSHGDKVTHILGAVYVHFRARGFEQRLFDDGLIAVYYFDPWFNEWKECPTFRANGSLGCRINNFGLYGLGLKQ
jgi:hypothetical protein